MVDHRSEALFACFVVEFLRACVFDFCQIARSFDDGHLHAQTDAKIGDIVLACELGGTDFAFGAALAKTAGDEDGVEVFELVRIAFTLENLAVDPFGADFDPVPHACVGEGFVDRFIGVFELNIFANDGNADFALGVVHTLGDVVPAGHGRFWGR